MSWELLRTDYKDAVPDGAQKYEIVQNPDGTVGITDVTDYIVKEDAFFGAMDANKINAAVNAIMASLEAGTDLYEAFNIFFENQKDLFTEEEQEYFQENQNVFMEWFESMKDQLSEDAAGNLQNQINDSNVRISSLEKNFSTESITYFVSLAGNDDLNDGKSLNSPFKSIQKAVDECPIISNPDDNVVSTIFLDFDMDYRLFESEITISRKRIIFISQNRPDNEHIKLPSIHILNGSDVTFSIDKLYYGGVGVFDFCGYETDHTASVPLVVENSRLRFGKNDAESLYTFDGPDPGIELVNSELIIDRLSAFKIYDLMFIQARQSNVRIIAHEQTFEKGGALDVDSTFILAEKNSFIDLFSYGSEETITIKGFNTAFEITDFSCLSVSEGVTITFTNITNKYVVNTFGLAQGANFAQLGGTSISSIGNGTITGAIKTVSDKLGNTSISGIGNGTVTGAIKTVSDRANNYITVGTVTFDVTSVNANGVVTLKKAVPAKSGYKPVFACVYRTNNANLVPYGCRLVDSSANVELQVRNMSSSAVNTNSSTAALIVYQRT